MGKPQPFTVWPLQHNSALLRQNPLGDPATRTVYVLTPPGVEPDRPLPAVWMLAAFTNSGRSFLNYSAWGESLDERLGRLYAEGAIGPLAAVLPDAFTAYGGSQYLDSIALGPYESYLWEELLPFVEERFPATGRALAGHSSGGYGAFVQAVRHPELFSAFACHSGDMGFEWCYFPDFPKLANALLATGGTSEFLAAFYGSPKKSSAQVSAMNLIAMAAAYSPNPAAAPMRVDLPVDVDTCALRQPVWERWLEKDPLRMIEREAIRRALSGLRLAYVDVGARDEYNLQWGARALHKRLKELRVEHVFELFDDTHSQVSYRFDRSLPLLYKALAGM